MPKGLRPASERRYRSTLVAHAEDVNNRDPRYVGREDVQTTLRRWVHPNTARTSRSVLLSFYDWTMEEAYRTDNPVRRTRRPKRRPTGVYRLTRDEVAAMLLATEARRERWAIYLSICCGLRNAELRGLQGTALRPTRIRLRLGRHRKGTARAMGSSRADLVAVVAEIRAAVDPDSYVLPALRFRDPPFNRQRTELSKRRSSSQALRTLVMNVAKRAGIAAHIHPHLLRHAYADHIARHAGIRNAQFLLGHAGIATTEIYVGKPSLEELAGSVATFSYGLPERTDVLGAAEAAETARKATTGIEPVYTALQAAA